MNELPNGAGGGPPPDLPPKTYMGTDRPLPINLRDLPVISVTPQSPGGEDEWNILEGSISQIQGIQESIQKMRDVQAISNSLEHGMKSSRFCTSCPSLNSARRFVPTEVTLRENEPAGEGVLASMYMPSMPENVPSSVDLEQRLSCSDNDPVKSKGQQRSVSLSSAESDNDDAFSKSGGAVTDRHEDYSEPQDYGQYGDVTDGFFRLKNTEDGVQSAASPPHKTHRSVNLQKSVSTPSILGNVEDGDAAVGGRQRLSQHFSGSDSEEEAILSAAVGAGYSGYGRGMVQAYPTKEPPPHVQYRDMLRDASSQEDDASANGKRRKRSSIFFKKKKDKDRSRRGPAVSGPSPVLIGPSASFSLSSTSSSSSLFIGGAKSLTLPSSNSGMSNKSAVVPQYYQSTSRLAPSGSSSILNRKPNGSSPTGTATKDFGRWRKSSIGRKHWKKVSDKLGLYRMLHEDRDEFIGDDHSPGFGDYAGDCFALDPREGNYVENEIARDFPELRLLEEEPEAWSKSVDKKISKSLTEVEVKRQEHIYEFMITEKHHCVTLQLMKKLFAGGMTMSLNYGPEIIRQIFPCLDDLIAWHSNFLRRLRERQDASAIVPTISDILVDQFSGECGAQLEKAYGIYCSQHKDAVSLYKDQLQRDRRFQDLVRLWSEHPLCKKKGIPECILFVTQRITKYPLLIDPLIKTSKTDPVERETLGHAMDLVKRILVNVNSQVAEKERDARLLEVYNRIDAKSSTMYLNKKFKKADLLLGKRKLKFEGSASMVLMPRGKPVELTVIVFSDIVLFLQESNQKYLFFTNDNKVCVLPISKLLVREKAGTDHNGFYLISSNPSDPEMYELICHNPRDRKVWINSIRDAIDNCPTGEEEDVDEGTRLRDARLVRIKQITVALQEYDQQLAKLCEEKIGLQFELLEVCGHEDVPSPPSLSQRYTTDLDMVALRDRLRQVVQEASRIASSLCANGATNLSRSASSVGEHQSNAYVSPILPRRAETFGGFDNSPKDAAGANRKRASPVPPELIEDRPRRTTLPAALPTEPGIGLLGAHSSAWTGSCSSGFQAAPSLTLPINPIAPGSKEQQMAVAQLSGYLSAIWCLVEHQCTNLESMKAELTTAYDRLTRLTGEDPRGTASGSGGKGNKTLLSHNQRLEELRNLQDKFTREKEAWEKDRKSKEEDFQAKEKELKELQDRLRSQTNDVVNQREQLYTKVQTLKNQGIILDANFHIVSTNAVISDDNSPRSNCSVIEINKNAGNSSGVASPQPNSPPLSASASAADFRKKLAETQRSKSVSSVGSGKNSQGTTASQQLPQHLISATNQQKVNQKAQNMQIKQQLPLKLAKLAEKSTSGGDRSSPGSSPSNSLQSPLNMSQEQEKVHQILPMKLSEDRGSKSGFGYQKFGTSGGTTPNIPQRVGAPQTFHSRSGSSPADIPPEQLHLAGTGMPASEQSTSGSGLHKSNSSGSRYVARPYSAIMGLRQQYQHQQQQPPPPPPYQRQTRPVQPLTVTRSEPQPATDATSNPRRSVDPDTNEEIIYF